MGTAFYADSPESVPTRTAVHLLSFIVIQSSESEGRHVGQNFASFATTDCYFFAHSISTKFWNPFLPGLH